MNAGDKHSRLTAISDTGKRTSCRGAVWLFSCECGATKEIAKQGVLNGRVQSCGCMAKERRLAHHLKHGAATRTKRTLEHQIWGSMKARCHNPNDANFHLYGGRGIFVCQEWRDSFDVFLSDMGPRKSPAHSLDRIDNDGPYAPWNCRWATQKEQMRNTSRCVSVVRDDGVSFNSVAEAAESVGVHPTGIFSVLNGRQAKSGGHKWTRV